MKYKWLNKNQNGKLIIFFNGWGMDECVVNHLNSEDYDVIMFYDYNSLYADFDFEVFSRYDELNLISWSMGVMVGAIIVQNNMSNLVFNKKVAINGTLKPIDIEFGIHPKIYDLTIKGFDKNGAAKFINSMFSDEPQTLNLSRNIEEQQSELIAIKNYSTIIESFYNKIFISDNDKIIPTKNQCKYWNMQPNLKNGHCPFFSFKSWRELL